MILKPLLALGALAHLPHASASALRRSSSSPSPTATCPARDPSLPTAFDGLYSNPLPGPNVPGTEWYWWQAISPQLPNGVIPSIEIVFYYGFAFTRGPADPPYRIDVSGVFPNGTSFLVSTPVDTPPLVTTSGQNVSGKWGDLGAFALFDDLQQAMVGLNVPDGNGGVGLHGGVGFVNAGTPPHGPCSDCTTVPPFFSPLAQGQALSDFEQTLYNDLGWATIMPRARAVVNVTVAGSQLLLEDAVGYHDKTWVPLGFDQFAYTWLSGQGSCGPYDITYGEVQALGSPRDKDVIKGFLAYDGRILQNQCSRFGEHRQTDSMSVSLTGQATDTVTGQQVPTGLTLEFVLANGTEYVFELHNSVEDPAEVVYHRWRLGGKGGRKGGEQFDCALIADWLNPSLAEYSQDGNIFNQQQPEA